MSMGHCVGKASAWTGPDLFAWCANGVSDCGAARDYSDEPEWITAAAWADGQKNDKKCTGFACFFILVWNARSKSQVLDLFAFLGGRRDQNIPHRPVYSAGIAVYITLGVRIMTWTAVDSNADLRELADSNCWEDSETLEFYATTACERYFPTDVSRSGYINMNIHVLLSACSPRGEILEIVFIDADWSSLNYLTHVFIGGRIDPLKRVNIEDANGSLEMRCSRIIYRYLQQDPVHRSGHYFVAHHQGSDTE
ncbi:MAG: hypothetical protein Q7J58_08490 [Hydrogenophaga sp.]|nr:hypothetical protein [Hydrogenophaga sp.]